MGAVPTTRGARLAWTLLAVALTVIYTLVLTFADTQRLSFANWAYLTLPQGLLAVGYGIGLSWLLLLQVGATRRASRKSSAGVGLVGAVGGVLPSFLCCTPFIPTLLGAFGASGIGLITTTGTAQGFFAGNEVWFQLAGLTVLAVSLVWSAGKLARARCAIASCDLDAGCRDRAMEAAATGAKPFAPDCAEDGAVALDSQIVQRPRA